VSDPHQPLVDIVVACTDARSIVARGRKAFESDPLLVRAAKNIVAEIGEAAKLVGDLTEQLPSVPWRAIVGMRDRTIHRYPEVDLDVLWETLATELAELAATITTFLDSQEGRDQSKP
jgi:uncharacterized protein with HEPN domain